MTHYDFRFERGSDGVAVLSFDRPETLNSLTFAIYGQLERLFLDLEDDDTVKAIVLTGHGRGVWSGGRGRGRHRPQPGTDRCSTRTSTRRWPSRA